MVNLPSVNPVGVCLTPERFHQRPRIYPASVRAIAAGLLLTFAVVVLWTGANSLAQYCLTSHAGAPFPFLN